MDQTRTKPQGTVRISCPVALLSFGIADIISQYLSDNPEVQVLVDATNRRVDVIEEGLDFAIRVRRPPLEDAELAVRQLGVSTFILVANPNMVERYPTPTSIDSLKDWPTVTMADSSERYIWNMLDSDGHTISLAHHPRLATDDIASLRSAAILGAGVALLPREFVDEDIRSGRLRHLLPELATKPGIVHAVFATRRGMVPAVRNLLDALVAGFEALNQRLYPGPAKKEVLPACTESSIKPA
ncbi:hypothetical protein GCM10011396_55150 [Undibacterium terreum]|uniref:LysR substrate-binding domain-containing protein n=1 Tax=Undibacterium terreum TaxID=1224302 RepID=A0A916XR77_9BURK|nr:hypothetical protein GCM10011396_55150 [Undibacterium terreum]